MATPRFRPDSRPGCAVRVLGGTNCGAAVLVGTFRGEWGGELVHRDRQGRTTQLAAVGVRRLLRARTGVVVVEASGRLRITSEAGTTLVDPDGTPHFEYCAQRPPRGNESGRDRFEWLQRP